MNRLLELQKHQLTLRKGDPLNHNPEALKPAAGKVAMGQFYDDQSPLELTVNGSGFANEATHFEHTDEPSIQMSPMRERNHFEPHEDAAAFEEMSPEVPGTDHESTEMVAAEGLDGVYVDAPSKEPDFDFSALEETPEAMDSKPSEDDYFEELKRVMEQQPVDKTGVDLPTPDEPTAKPEEASTSSDAMSLLQELQARQKDGNDAGQEAINFDVLEQGMRDEELFGQLGEDTVELYVLEQPPGPDTAIDKEAKLRPDALRASTIKEMVEVVDKAAAGRKIRMLTISGHGSPGNISIGDGKGWMHHKHMNSNRSQWETELKKLAKLMDPNGKVYLAGCRTGAGTKGSDKLKQFADVLGVPVEAPTGDIYPDGREEKGSKHQIAYPNKKAPTPIEAPKKASAKSIVSGMSANVRGAAVHFVVGNGLPEAGQMPESARMLDASLVSLLQRELDFSQSMDESLLLADTNAILYLDNGDETEAYEVFNDYNLVAPFGRRETSNSVSDSLQQALRNLEPEAQKPFLSMRHDDFFEAQGENETVEIDVIEKPTPADLFCEQVAGRLPHGLRITNLDNLVQSVINEAAGRKIAKLTIHGHGAPGIIATGEGKGSAPNQHINGNKEAWGEPLKHLKGMFAPDAVVFLRGCKTGAEKEGSEKLKELADFLGVTVKAPTGDVYSLGAEDPGSVHQVAHPDKPAPKAIPEAKSLFTTAHGVEAFSQVPIDGVLVHSVKGHGLPTAGTTPSTAQPADDALINLLRRELDFSAPKDKTSLGAKTNLVMYLDQDGARNAYEVFNHYNLIAAYGKREKSYALSEGLHAALKSRYHKGGGGLTAQMGEEAIAIRVIEKFEPSDQVTDDEVELNPDALRATSVEHMVDLVIAHAAGRKIGRLIISGHGARGNISVGDGKGFSLHKTINGKTASGKVTTWKKYVPRLKKHMAPNAQVMLYGCEVGAGAEGSYKLKEVADFLGVTVRAPTGEVYHDGTMVDGSVYQIAHPGQPAPVPIPAPIPGRAHAHGMSAPSLGTIEHAHIHLVHGVGLPSGGGISPSAVQANASLLRELQQQGTFSGSTDGTRLKAKTNAILYLTIDGKVQAYEVFSGFKRAAPWNQRAASTVVSSGLRTALEAMESGNS